MASPTDPGNMSLGLTFSDGALSPAEQSCKECRRRKAKCDRSLPACTVCTRYKRHCLYEKHSRTPLTRKHLTEVEEKLERAEALIRRFRRSNCLQVGRGDISDVPDTRGSTGGPEPNPISIGEHFDFCNLDSTPPGVVRHAEQYGIGTASTRTVDDGPATRVPEVPVMIAGSREGTTMNISRDMPETPPREDFEWDERGEPHHLQAGGAAVVEGNGEQEQPIADGMASLSVGEQDGGYLGVASGAALLRMIEPDRGTACSKNRPRRHEPYNNFALSLTQAPDPNRHIVDTMIDAYFAQYHISYPIVHEPSFRAQYAEVVPQPHGACWRVLAYTVAAIGVWASATETTGTLDLELFAHARALLLGSDVFELGNLTLVQALTLMSNYQQKRDKPNSGYNYLGLAVRMATGLGLHKEFGAGWEKTMSPLRMEVRRRVWWCLCVFDVGATVTFSRPVLFPFRQHDGVEVTFPLNITDRDLTANTPARYTPRERDGEFTQYTAVGVQARFHVATNPIYTRVISKPFPAAEELFDLEASHLDPWLKSLPPHFRPMENETASPSPPPRYAHAHAVMQWRYRNLRIIMFRTVVLRRALRRSSSPSSPHDERAFTQCLADAEWTISSIANYWSSTTASQRNRLTGWYALYFLFQAALIPCVCLRNSPDAEAAASWAAQVRTTLRTIRALAGVNSSCTSCWRVIVGLCGRYLGMEGGDGAFSEGMGMEWQWEQESSRQIDHGNTNANDQVSEQQQPIDESPQTQINHVFPMMWPNVNALEAADEVMGNDAWLSFLADDVQYSTYQPR